jgi:hypothetical protein
MSAPTASSRIRHRRAQLLALFRGQRAENILHDLTRKIRRKICNLVGIELLGRGDQLFGLHMRDERFAHRVGNFEQNFAVAISLYEIPYSQPFLRVAAPPAHTRHPQGAGVRAFFCSSARS